MAGGEIGQTVPGSAWNPKKSQKTNHRENKVLGFGRRASLIFQCQHYRLTFWHHCMLKLDQTYTKTTDVFDCFLLKWKVIHWYFETSQTITYLHTFEHGQLTTYTLRTSLHSVCWTQPIVEAWHFTIPWILFLLQRTSHIMSAFALRCERFYATVLLCLPLVCFSLITGTSSLLSAQDTTEIRSTNISVTTRACPTTRSLCTPSTKGSKGHFLTRRSSSIWNFMPMEGLSVSSRRVFDGNFVQTLCYWTFHTLFLVYF